MKLHSPPTLLTLALATICTTTSCMSDPYGSYQRATPVQKGALTGALAGAAIGGIAERDFGGVAIGAAVGALAGAATGHVISENQRRHSTPPYEQTRPGYQSDPYHQAPPRADNRYYPPTPPPPREQPAPPLRTQPQIDEQSYPTAQKTNRPDRVISPYPPHNTIDVAGFKTGDLAIDPTTEKIFKIP